MCSSASKPLPLCGQTGHFASQCSAPQRPRPARGPPYVLVRPPVQDLGGAGSRSFVDGVNLRGGVSALATAAEEEAAGVGGLVAALQGQVNLQAELLEARALIERQAEIMEHQMRSAAQPAEGPPGIRPRAGGAVSQIGNWSTFFGARDVTESQEQARARSVAHQPTVMRKETSFGQ